MGVATVVPDGMSSSQLMHILVSQLAPLPKRLGSLWHHLLLASNERLVMIAKINFDNGQYVLGIVPAISAFT